MTQAEAERWMTLLRQLVDELTLAIVLIEHNMRVVMEVQTGSPCSITARRSRRGRHATSRPTRA